MQSRIGSLVESSVNILIGYFVALISQIVLFPLFDIYISIQTNLWISGWFTLISLARSYVIRRWFNGRIHAASMGVFR